VTGDEIRAFCLGLGDDVSERLSHGHPGFFRGKRLFLHHMRHHHGDPHDAIWCAAPPGMQEALAQGEPEHYFRPPYVGHRGWVGVRLDTGLARDNVLAAIEDAYDCVG
jgi:hypothetical protein